MNRESVGAVDVAVVICPRRELLTRSMKLFRVAACGCVILKEYEYRSSLLLSKLSVNGFMLCVFCLAV